MNVMDSKNPEFEIIYWKLCLLSTNLLTTERTHSKFLFLCEKRDPDNRQTEKNILFVVIKTFDNEVKI